jgi:hypothetical protein
VLDGFFEKLESKASEIMSSTTYKSFLQSVTDKKENSEEQEHKVKEETKMEKIENSMSPEKGFFREVKHDRDV